MRHKLQSPPPGQKTSRSKRRNWCEPNESENRSRSENLYLGNSPIRDSPNDKRKFRMRIHVPTQSTKEYWVDVFHAELGITDHRLIGDKNLIVSVRCLDG